MAYPPKCITNRITVTCIKLPSVCSTMPEVPWVKLGGTTLIHTPSVNQSWNTYCTRKQSEVMFSHGTPGFVPDAMGASTILTSIRDDFYCWWPSLLLSLVKPKVNHDLLIQTVILPKTSVGQVLLLLNSDKLVFLPKPNQVIVLPNPATESGKLF